MGAPGPVSTAMSVTVDLLFGRSGWSADDRANSVVVCVPSARRLTIGNGTSP